MWKNAIVITNISMQMHFDIHLNKDLLLTHFTHGLNVEFLQNTETSHDYAIYLNASQDVIWVHSVSFIYSQGAVKSHWIIIGFIYKVCYVSVSAQKAWSCSFKRPALFL